MPERSIAWDTGVHRPRKGPFEFKQADGYEHTGYKDMYMCFDSTRGALRYFERKEGASVPTGRAIGKYGANKGRPVSKEEREGIDLNTNFDFAPEFLKSYRFKPAGRIGKIFDVPGAFRQEDARGEGAGYSIKHTRLSHWRDGLQVPKPGKMSCSWGPGRETGTVVVRSSEVVLFKVNPLERPKTRGLVTPLTVFRDRAEWFVQVGTDRDATTFALQLIYRLTAAKSWALQLARKGVGMTEAQAKKAYIEQATRYWQLDREIGEAKKHESGTQLSEEDEKLVAEHARRGEEILARWRPQTSVYADSLVGAGERDDGTELTAFDRALPRQTMGLPHNKCPEREAWDPDVVIDEGAGGAAGGNGRQQDLTSKETEF